MNNATNNGPMRISKRATFINKGDRMVAIEVTSGDVETTAMSTDIVKSCPCGASHGTDAPGSRYFVSVVDGPRYSLAAGPYDTHAAALADVEEVRAIGEEVDPRAVWFAWGTCRVDADVLRIGRLNEELARRRALAHSVRI